VNVVDDEYSTRQPLALVDPFAGSVVPLPLMANEFTTFLLPPEEPPPTAFMVDDGLFWQFTCPASAVSVAL
jgi:hypothetical protein